MGWLEDFVTWLGTNFYIPFGLSGDNLAPLYPSGSTFYEIILEWGGQFVGILLSIGPLLPVILFGMFATALLTSLDRFDPQPLLDFTFMLWDTSLNIVMLLVSAIDAVLPL